MKTIRWIITAAATVLVGLILTSWLREPIDNYFRSDRIEATLAIGPWVEMPINRKSDRLKPLSGTDEATAIIRAPENLDEDFRTKPTNFSELSIENKSEVEINNIKIKFGSSQYRIAYEVEGDKNITVSNDTDKVTLPNMKPGDKIIVHAWGSYYGGPEIFAESIRTYSSSGPFRILADWSGGKKLNESALDEFMNNWANFIFGSSFVILTIIGFILSALIGDKLKKVLSDEQTYQSEKTRYEKDPKNYNALEENKPDT